MRKLKNNAEDEIETKWKKLRRVGFNGHPINPGRPSVSNQTK
jgi:hypothetical protein